MKFRPVLETLESRDTPSTWSVLDSFAVSTISDPTFPLLPFGEKGIYVNHAHPFDTGTDTGLQSASQFADTRTVTLSNPVGPNSGFAGLYVYTTIAGLTPGLTYNAPSQLGATLDLDYSGLSSTPAGPVTLSDGNISLVFGFMDNVPETITVSVNGTAIGTQTINSPQTITFDASALVGQQLNSVHVTITGGQAGDFQLAEIDASIVTLATAGHGGGNGGTHTNNGHHH